MDAKAVLESRVEAQNRPWQVESTLHDFAMVTYAVDLDKASRLIDSDRFEIQPFQLAGRTKGLISAVNFADEGLHFTAFPFIKADFFQTNFRLYVIDRKTGEPEVFFLGTVASTPLLNVPKVLWGAPWYRGKFNWNCVWDSNSLRYASYEVSCNSAFGNYEMKLEDTGRPPGLLEGFSDLDEQNLILTNPVMGSFLTKRGTSQYEVWHLPIVMTETLPLTARFPCLESLGLISASDLPHSVMICPKTKFKIEAPPRRI